MAGSHAARSQGRICMRNVLGFLGGTAAGNAELPSGPQANGALNDNDLLDHYSRAVVGSVDTIAPAVVHVEVAGMRNGHRAGGTGSGVIVSPDGLMLTNNHVIDGAKEIAVSLS